MRLWGIVVGMALAVATCACTNGQSTPSADDLFAADNQSSPGIRLPFEEFEFTPQQQADLDYVTRRISQQCMHDAGFHVMSQLSPNSDVTVRNIVEYKSRRYGITDATIASHYGYHLSRQSRGAADPVPLDGLSANERAAFARCTQKTNSRVRPIAEPDSKNAEIVSGLGIEVFNRTRSDPRAHAVFSAWSDCIGKHGHSYSDPFEAAADPRWDNQADLPADMEIEVATADIRCKEQTGLISVLTAVETEHQRTAISKHPNVFDTSRNNLTRQVAQLSQLLREYP